MVWAAYLMLGNPASSMLTSATANDLAICITAPNISMGSMLGRVMYHSSIHRLRMPSMAPASYWERSMFCSPAINARNPAPRDSQICTRITMPRLICGSVSHKIGSSISPMRISRPLIMP